MAPDEDGGTAGGAGELVGAGGTTAGGGPDVVVAALSVLAAFVPAVDATVGVRPNW